MPNETRAKPKYTNEELNEFGDRLARLLNLKKLHVDSEGRQRWRTEWGDKTGVGLMLTLERAVDAMNEGKLGDLLP